MTVPISSAPAPNAAATHAPLVRALGWRVAMLAAVAAIAGAVGARFSLGIAAAAALVVAAIGAVLARRWMRRELVAPLEQLTEQLRAEQAQRARVEKLATVGQMAAGIAHEVGNPLAAIGGYAHVLRSRAASVHGAPEVLDALERECDRIDRIVHGLLDYARPRRVTPTVVDVNSMLVGARTLLANQGVLRRVTLTEELDPAQPTVFGERHELEQIFVNLLLNAADATERTGSIALRTRVVPVAELRSVRGRAGDAPGEYVPHRPHRRVAEWLSGSGVGGTRAPRMVVQLVVADSGSGIALEDAERVFDPFFTTKSGGTGLGLAIVARIVDALGGAVWVQRAREGGAAFVVVLPLADGHAAQNLPPSPAEVEALELPLFVRNDSIPPALK